MRYLDSKARSAEHLRAALPLMTRQNTALHPVSYAIWYEYVSGTNPDLNRRMQELTQHGAALDDAQTWALFRKHVAEPDNEAARQLSDGVTQVIESMAASAAQAGEDAARIDASLGGWVEQLLDQVQQEEQQPAPADLLQEVVANTREIRQVMDRLQVQLDASQGEIRRLRDEVQRARNEAFVDALTGLANRRAFEQQLDACIAAAPQTPAQLPWLMLGDIDHFKAINDSFGHVFGDQVLRAVAQTLKSVAAPEGALPARIGGEEFALLLPCATLAQAQALADQMRQKVALGRIRRGEQNECIARVTISLGLTQMQRGEGAGAFFERADQALYASKRDGRNRVSVLDSTARSGPQSPQLPGGERGQQQRTGTLHA
ncbi:GGDEF domain-containing protein [Paucibacter sp. R3-3]|uniref:diguanylate cyclase n=1 Tax=Roseateles agri TaxID=3098619 RepID=A0ABU5DN33_9BURK|nr:GGDEF domain-containing protein [Paucibacter sp. R3-3]MDY0746684.1 GGDEF domain-containing protein [Paucibacter sp. R3-3]